MLPRIVRRLWLRAKVARLDHEVAVLEHERHTYEQRLDIVLRELAGARIDLFMVEYQRRPVDHAPGRPRMQDAVVRPISGQPIPKARDVVQSITSKRRRPTEAA
jgi:hypothetical protein